jgi:hypothetical protein
MWLAFDRAPASRCRFDSDGRLHARSVPISRAGVSEYPGDEVPNWRRLALSPQRSYRMFRSAGELRKAASTFCGLPILSRHIALDEAVRPELVIGAVGTDARFDDQSQSVRATLTIWDRDALAAIKDGTKCELSCGYCYGPGPRIAAGRFRNQAFDGIMTDLVGHHVALVRRGKCGPSCAIMLGDEMMEDSDDERRCAA